MTDRPTRDCETCGGARLSGTGHKVWCSGHILSPARPRRIPEWRRRALDEQGGERFVAVKEIR